MLESVVDFCSYIVESTAIARSPGKLLYLVGDSFSCFYIPDYIFSRPEFELLSLITRAELTTVPWAVSGYPYQQ